MHLYPSTWIDTADGPACTVNGAAARSSSSTLKSPIKFLCLHLSVPSSLHCLPLHHCGFLRSSSSSLALSLQLHTVPWLLISSGSNYGPLLHDIIHLDETSLAERRSFYTTREGSSARNPFSWLLPLIHLLLSRYLTETAVASPNYTFSKIKGPDWLPRMIVE